MKEMLWEPLAEGRIYKIYEPGQMIYLQSEEPKEFFYLAEGTARSYISSAGGAELVLTYHHSGDLMGEASFFDQCPRVSSAVAVTCCQIATIDRKQLNLVFQNHPELAYPMLQYLARTVRLLSDHVDRISFLPADKRLATALLRHADANFVHSTHEELSSSIGASRVTVSRILSRFSENGWIVQKYGVIELLDSISLSNYADGNL